MIFNNRTRTYVIAMSLLLCLSSISSNALALKEDADQPIYIESNSATYDDAKGVSIYLGDVEVNQGSMRMTSDELIIYLKDGSINKLVSKGTPVRFKQTPESGKQDIRGKSLYAEYYPNKALLILKKKAIVWQGDDTYASEIIEYDNKNSIVKAGETSTDNKRVRVVLQPKKEKIAEDDKTGGETSREKIQ